MPKYMFHANYTIGPGVQGLVKDGGTGRREAVGKLIQGLGGTMESFYFTFGSDDVFAIAELPDDASAAAAALTVASPGTATVRTTVLLDPETVDEAAKKVTGYRAPGG